MKSWDREAERTTVVVTGIGMMTALASGRENTWQKLLENKSGIKFDHQLQLPVARINCLEDSNSSRSQDLL